MSAGQRVLALTIGAATAVSLCAAVPSAAVASAPSPTAQPYASVVRGLAPVVHPGAVTATHAPSTRSKAARTRPVTGSSTSVAAPVAPAREAPAAPNPPLHNFNGVSSRDSEFTNYNQEFEPPDQGLCTGFGFVIDAVNSAYTISSLTGHVLRGPTNINNLFNEGGTEFTSDPRCYFDPTSDRWFATILFLNSAFTRGRIDIAVSETSDPTGLWQQYQIDTSDLGGNGCPCFGDQPRLGMDQNNLYVSTDEFSINGPQFNGGQLYAIAKPDLLAGATAHFVHFADLSSGGSLALAVEPALTTGNSDAEYFMNSLDPNATFDTRLGVWAMTHGDRVASGGMPTLSQTVITSEPYGLPPAAEQNRATSHIDSGDDRMQQTQFINGELWGELTTGVTVPGDSTERAGAAWFAVRPTLQGSRIGATTIDRQGYVVSAGHYVLYPALQADAAGRAAIVFTLTGSDMFPSAAFVTLPATGTQASRPRIAAAGSNRYDPNATRWGDYSFAVLDPVRDAVWLATEYVPPRSSQTTDGRRNWGTRVLEVALS